MRRVLPWALVALALALVAGGIALFVFGNRPGDFGWTAYTPSAPLPDAYRSSLLLTFDDGPAVLWTRTSAIGAGTALVGLLTLTGVAGWAAGVRSSRRPID